MMLLEGDHRSWHLDAAATAVSVGVYDGVHRGHQHVLAAARDHAGGLPLVVVTFRQHPATVVTPGSTPPLLTSVDHRIQLLEAYGADTVAVLEFDERLRTLDPRLFVEDVLVDALHAAWVVVGSGFKFGYKLGGDVELLRDLGAVHGFEVEGIPIVGGDHPVRSTAIREALADGDVGAATDMLGRTFQVRATVVEGDKRGRALGFPTANLVMSPELVRPRRGVYACWAGVEATNRPAVVNIGVRPTVDGTKELVEVHLLDGDAELYGAELWVDFVARIRDERTFPSLDALVAQISADAGTARGLLGRS